MNKGAMNGAMNGAAQGAQMGGGYGAIAGAVIGFVVGDAQYKKQLKAVEAHNKLVMKETTQQLFDLSKQRNIDNMRTGQALREVQAAQSTQTSAVRSSYGAAELLGGSTAALEQVLQFQAEEAKAAIIDDWSIGVDNQNTQLNNMVSAASNQLVNTVEGKKGDTDFGGVVSGALDMYNKYRGGTGAQPPAGYGFNLGGGSGVFGNLFGGNASSNNSASGMSMSNAASGSGFQSFASTLNFG